MSTAKSDRRRYSAGSRPPPELAHALLTIAKQTPPPRRFIAGADAIAGAEQKVVALTAEIDSTRELSTSLAIDEGSG